MCLLRIFQLLCVFTCSTVLLHANAPAQNEAEIKSATRYIQKFGDALVVLLGKGDSLDAFRALIRSTFNLPHLAKQCCPVKYEKLSADQRKTYEKKFEEKICKEYFSLLQKYYTPRDSVNDHFKVDDAKSKQYPSGSGICSSIWTEVFASNGARIYVKWIVKGNKIENFVVEGTDMRAAKKRDLKTQYKQSGNDISKFLNTFSQSISTSE
jgi:ABC-type transporter MlaC component